MRRVGGLVMLIPNGLLARANMKIRARVQSRALAADPIASGRLAADPIASDPEEGSIALLIVGMLRCFCSSVR